MSRELSQNLKAVLQEVGEGAALLKLSIELFDKPSWRVYRNYAEDGCDIVILGPRQQMIKIEVKSRQNLITKDPDRHRIHFTLSEKEYYAADFLVAYWFDRAAFFIVPRTELKRVKSGTKYFYKFILYFSDKSLNNTRQYKQYHEKWDLILDRMRNS